MHDIGITTMESAWINTIAALVSILGPLIAGPVAYKCNKFRTLIILCLVVACVFYTSLLFVPRVIRTPRYPQIYFDCTNNQLKIEQCPDWGGQCHIHPQRPSVGNFTNFTLAKCKHVCSENLTIDSPQYPIHVCFISSSEGNLCLSEDPRSIKRDEHSPAAPSLTPVTEINPNEDSSLHTFEAKVDHLVQFDSRFDRWPLVESSNDLIEPKMCTFRPTAPLLVNHRPYDSINCRPAAENCMIHCNVNILHRPHSPPNAAPRPPVPCYDLTGNPKATFYSYLIFRCCADFALFTAFALIDALAITFTNNFDSLYGGLSKVLTIAIPLAFWSPICGLLVDYYSSLAKQSDYAPPFILFDGMALISCALVIALPITPFTSPILSIQSQTSLRSLTSFRRYSYNKETIPLKSKCILILLFPVILVLGTQWGLLETFLLPFFLQMNPSKLWIGLTFTITFLAFAPFALVVKSLTSAVGRAHLIVLGFVFYALRLSGTSFLSKPKWTLFPFEAMEAFTLPIAWIGITSYCHHLIQRNSRSYEILKNGVSSSTSTHLVLQYFLIIVHFGFGRALGSFFWGLWDWRWLEDNDLWVWLTEKETDGYSYSFRVLLRFLAIISAVFAIIFFLFYHICCKFRPGKPSKPSTNQSSNEQPVVLNGVHYSRLVEKQENSAEIPEKQTNGDTNIKMIDE
ncbi:hypothetical protein B4U79_17677 [Dinothrombium tinctorium]|uniref:Major facilitator superfamily associated domain-containing protein n=1 Tax=Dinothrombium tinctorium TaxID=1965070 RepID=A0A3S3P7J0_9ACAR|nr:hypothetical protein B4U79_14483 [Dinothrombium tinctorium]RWS09607.1 hypothetical protein B4U79_17677 [Dinothrombium tinctorium]